MTDIKEEIKEEVKSDEVVVDSDTKIKLGEEEFTQDELNSLVGLGKIAREAEEKYNVKVEGIWPKFQSTINENVEFRKKQEEKEKALADEELNNKPQEELTEQEQLKLASLKLKELGFVSRDEIQNEVNNILTGKQLLTDVNSLVEKQSELGNPKTSAEELLTYMSENGLKNPEVAYKIKFEAELDSIKEKKLGSIKKGEFVTDETAGGGIKNPETKPITRNNLSDALSDVLGRE
jgi:hypothetical protein